MYIMHIDEKIAFLRQPAIYPDRPKRVEVIETHMSWVFLTENLVYKLKKPVRYAYLDFSTLEDRQKDCEWEVSLNRRLAGHIYLGAVPLTIQGNGDLQLGGEGRLVDWLVQMRRLPAERMLDAAIREGTVDAEDVMKLSQALVNFYRSSLSLLISPAEYRRRFEEDIQSNLIELRDTRYALPKAQVERLTAAQRQFLAEQGHLLEQRARDGRIIDAHGDLRPQHICLTAPPVIIDCLEFNREFRILDPVDELAYLSMECERLGAPQIGEQILDYYSETVGEVCPFELIGFYKAFRACLRAKIAVWHIADHQVQDHQRWLRLAQTYLDLAERYLPRC
jgi:aminoglycoside phosphotransferase family enzyme